MEPRIHSIVSVLCLVHVFSLLTCTYVGPRSKFGRSFLLLTGMDMISLEGKTNFFEKRVGEYQKSGVMASVDQTKASSRRQLNFDVDF
jgi:hypothetical protein